MEDTGDTIIHGTGTDGTTTLGTGDSDMRSTHGSMTLGTGDLHTGLGTTTIAAGTEDGVRD